MGAKLKRWNRDDKGWKAETLWSSPGRVRPPGHRGGGCGRRRRRRVIIATHDYGVVAVNPAEPGGEPEGELDKKADTFVHEIEVGDINGDGKVEFFATPSDPTAGTSQAGEIVMYRYDGETYKRIVVDGGPPRQGDPGGRPRRRRQDRVLQRARGRAGEPADQEPVKIRLYTENDGTFSHEDVVTIDDQQTRFSWPATSTATAARMVAAAMKTGLYIDSG